MVSVYDQWRLAKKFLSCADEWKGSQLSKEPGYELCMPCLEGQMQCRNDTAIPTFVHIERDQQFGTHS